jgi:hypothetical protein
LDFTCSKPLVVIITGTLLGLILVITSVSIGSYRYRWELRYFCLKLTQRSKQYQLLVDQQTHYEYDAFVVYDSADRQWVNNELLTHLEDQATSDGSAIRLCVHERDFPPGEDIIGNIWNKMESSRKTILIVSKKRSL